MAGLNIRAGYATAHIPIVTPPQSSTDYYNRKGFYSIVLQAVVDHQYRYDNTLTACLIHIYIIIYMLKSIE